MKKSMKTVLFARIIKNAVAKGERVRIIRHKLLRQTVDCLTTNKQGVRE